MLVKAEACENQEKKRTTFAVRVRGEMAQYCEYLDYMQLAKLRKSLVAIVTEIVTDKSRREK